MTTLGEKAKQSMTDIVNGFFKQFYPQPLDSSKFRYDGMLGGMLRYEDHKADKIFPRIECNDGFHMSVQAHDGSYSRPRNDFAPHYSAVEVGFPSDREELLMPYIDGGDVDPTENVYGYVPVEVVVAVIEKHGGLKGAYVYPEASPSDSLTPTSP